MYAVDLTHLSQRLNKNETISRPCRGLTDFRFSFEKTLIWTKLYLRAIPAKIIGKWWSKDFLFFSVDEVSERTKLF